MVARSALHAMPPLETVARETMAGQVYQQLREAIMSGRFAPGQPLSLRSVADAVGSSTMPVRGALMKLQAEGALVEGPGRALMVPPMSLEGLEELRDVRIALEGCVVERAAARLTDASFAEIERIYQAMQKRVDANDVAGYLRCNFAFHTAIYAQGAGDITLATIQNMWMRIGPFLNLFALDVTHMQRSMVAHRIIVEALARRDGAAAREGIAQDIGDAAQGLAERLKAQAER